MKIVVELYYLKQNIWTHILLKAFRVLGMRSRTYTHFKIPQVILDMNYIIHVKINYILQILKFFKSQHL